MKTDWAGAPKTCFVSASCMHIRIFVCKCVSFLGSSPLLIFLLLPCDNNLTNDRLNLPSQPSLVPYSWRCSPAFSHYRFESVEYAISNLVFTLSFCYQGIT